MTDERPTVHVLDALLALRDKRKRAAGGAFGRPRESGPDNSTFSSPDPDDPFAGPKVITNPARYADSALTRVLDELGGLAPDCGHRNASAHKAGQVVGRLVGAKLLTDPAAALEAVIDACRRNGLVDDDGLKATQDSVASGYRWGVEHPVEWEAAPSSEPAAVQVPVDRELAEVRNGAGELVTVIDVTPPDARTSWWPTPILEGADAVDDEPPPGLLVRTDGQALLYAGKVNALIGESESGKTWVALHAIGQTLAAGGKVAMLDFEDTRRGVRARLRDLGASDDELARFYYAQPDSGLSAEAAADVATFIGDTRPALVVLDGVNAAMTQLGYDLQDNKDVTAFTRILLKPLARLDAAVLTIDHVTKSKDGRGSYAIGAQAKRADVDGAAFIVEVVQPFGRGLTGRLRITVAKDRPGYVRGAAVGAKRIGDVIIASNRDGAVSMSLVPPDSDEGESRRALYVAMEATCDALASIGRADPPTSQEEVRKLVGGKRDMVIEVLGELERRGHVARDVDTGKPRAGLGYRVVRPFQAALGDADEV